MTALVVAGPCSAKGTLRVPGDKSISHRALLLAALADGTSTVRGLSDGEDVARTRAAVEAMGAVVEGERITGGDLGEPAGVVDVGNSGTAIRLLAGVCSAQPWLTVLAGDDSVASRPMDRVVAPLRRMGATIDGRDDGRLAPLAIRGGGLRGTDYAVPMASAQVKSAILLAGLGAAGETVVRERVATRAHTEELLALAGADIEVEGLAVRVRPSTLKPFDLDVPGDPSQAAFWVVAACITPGGDVTVQDVYLGPARTGYLGVLRRMGADLEVDEGAGTIRARSSALRATVVDGAEIAGLDEVPVLAVAAACAEGTTTFTGAGELRFKETDRVATTTAMLAAMGVDAEARDDGIVVVGGSGLRPGRVDAGGDHRIAMAAAVAALAAEGDTTIEGWESVATSYMGFEEVLATWAS